MVDALLALAKVPAPPVHVPLPLVVADILIGVMPHTAYGPFASAIAADKTFTVTFVVTAGQGPLPSGSVVVQVS